MVALIGKILLLYNIMYQVNIEIQFESLDQANIFLIFMQRFKNYKCRVKELKPLKCVYCGKNEDNYYALKNHLSKCNKPELTSDIFDEKS